MGVWQTGDIYGGVWLWQMPGFGGYGPNVKAWTPLGGGEKGPGEARRARGTFGGHVLGGMWFKEKIN